MEGWVKKIKRIVNHNAADVKKNKNYVCKKDG